MRDAPHCYLVGPLPPPYVGPSLSFRMLVRAFGTLGIPHSVIDIGADSPDRTDGQINLSRSRSLLGPLAKAIALIVRPRGNVYLTLAQTRAGFLRDLVVLTAARLGRHRAVVHLKGGNYRRFYDAQSPWLRRRIRSVLAGVDRIVVLSAHYRELFDFVPGASSKVAVVENGCPLPPSLLPTEPKRLPQGDRPLRLLFLSNLIESKGYLEVLEAVRLLRDNYGRRVEARFCGEFLVSQDSYRFKTVAAAKADFHARIAEYGLGDSIAFLGSVDGEAKLEQLRAADVFLLPSQYVNEGQPVSIIEALAHGCIVVTSRFRALPELVDDGRAGIVLDPCDAREIARDIDALAGDPARFEATSRNAMQRFRERYTQARHLQALVSEIAGCAVPPELAESAALSPAYSPEERIRGRSVATLIGYLPPPLNGLSVAMSGLCRALRDRGIPFDVIDLGGETGTRAEGKITLRRILGLLPALARGAKLLVARRQTVYLTVAQSWGGFLRDQVFILAAWLGRHRLVVHLHGGNYDRFYSKQTRLRQRMMRWALGRADRFVVLGTALRDVFAFVPGHAAKTVVVANGIDFAPGTLPQSPRTLPTAPAPIRILYLSNLVPSKGYLEVLEAVRILVHEHHVSVVVRFCGEFMRSSERQPYPDLDAARADFADRIRRHGLSDRVTFVGVVDGVAKFRELAGADVFILPTRYSNEGQPLSIIEAMAFGVVVISTRYRTIPELLDDGDAGVLLDDGSAESIARAVADLTRTPERYRQMSERAIRRFNAEYTGDCHFDKLIRLLVEPTVHRRAETTPSPGRTRA